jgi:hypothetical protein
VTPVAPQAVLVPPAAPQPAPATVLVVQAQAPTVTPVTTTPVTILKEKCRVCKAIGALGERMVRVGQPSLATVNAVVTTGPQAAVVQASPQALASPQATATVIPAAPSATILTGKRWWQR